MPSDSRGVGCRRPAVPPRLDARQRALTWREIQEQHGISRNTLKSWVRRRHLRPIHTEGRRHLYLEADVLECERARRLRLPSNQTATIMDIDSGDSHPQTS